MSKRVLIAALVLVPCLALADLKVYEFAISNVTTSSTPDTADNSGVEGRLVAVSIDQTDTNTITFTLTTVASNGLQEARTLLNVTNVTAQAIHSPKVAIQNTLGVDIANEYDYPVLAGDTLRVSAQDAGATNKNLTVRAVVER